MRFDKSNSQSKRTGSCSECGAIGTHSPDCSRFMKTEVECMPPVYDYSHLVESSVEYSDREFDATHFDGLLTDEDRILLRFGMHIAW